MCFCMSLLFLCGCLGVAQECVGFSRKKRSLQRFEEPNQRLANFPCLLCSSEATAGLLFSRLPPFWSPLSHLLSSVITEGPAGGLCSSPGFVLPSFIAVALEKRASL